MPTILVIEDEPSIRDNIADLLEASGYEPIKATDGQAGIEKARRYAPDVIVCDVMMPHTDGHEVLHAIREDDALAATPFIFLTARSTRDDLREGMDGGADDYVTKPFRTADLLNAIEARLDRREAIEEEQERQLDSLRHTISAILPHELRTPLMGIEGYSQLLMADWDELDGAEARDLLGEVVASSNRLKQLIENYILYARLAAGLPVETPAEPTSVGEIVRLKAEDLAGNHDRLSDLQLTIEPGQVSLSSALFAKLIRELIDNAFRFSGAGTPVHIRGERIGDQYRLVIRDGGRGMTADQLKRIGAFVQFDRHEFEQQGSGLGLTIAREIIDHSEGALDIESTSGRGTTVTAQLPLAKPVAPDAAANSSRRQPAR
jgi:signal transduction histidine kinase